LSEQWRQRGRGHRIHADSGPKKVDAMKLPEVATRLRELAQELDCDELNALASEIARRPSGERAPPSSAPMTDELRDEIRAIKRAKPEISQEDIGRALNINPGMVSETLNGKRS
jgi:hypothetical protein